MLFLTLAAGCIPGGGDPALEPQVKAIAASQGSRPRLAGSKLFSGMPGSSSTPA